MSIARWADREHSFRTWAEAAPVATIAVAALIYVAVTGASLPGAAALTLFYGWLFGFWIALPLVSGSSTAWATVAMLASRWLFRDIVERRFAGRLSGFRAALAAEGPYYLFTLRLIPAAPFFVVNALMGLAPIRVRTFWWVSQAGMLPGTALYVYAGSSVPSLRKLADEGLAAVFDPGQVTRLTVALALIGLFPWLARLGVKKFAARRPSAGPPAV
ncbi:MAG: TVP38/TMEM64 family protein [Planctomycetota bacterium]